MKNGEQAFANDLINELDQFRYNGNQLLNFANTQQKVIFARQVRDSIRRINFIQAIGNRAIDPLRANPNSDLFDPIRGSIYLLRQGQFDEACWLTFIGSHFGKHHKTGWSLARQVYGALGSGGLWDWHSILNAAPNFRAWMIQNEATFIENSAHWKFSNHRKYQSMKVTAPTGTVTVFETYVNWIQSYGNHRDLFLTINQRVGQNPHDNFDYLFKEMNAVKGFGRLGKFDHLTMLGKIGLAAIEPPSPYIQGSTGPRAGAELIFNEAGATSKSLNDKVKDLGKHLSLGMQVMEDALCNWQKSPNNYILFMG